MRENPINRDKLLWRWKESGVKGQMDRSRGESEMMMNRERSRTIINVGGWMGEMDMA